MGRPTLFVEIGELFGLWEVIDNTPTVKDGHSYVKVKCTYCGNEEYKATSDLKRRNTLGCKKCMGLRKQIPINVGDKFGKWTVISEPIKGIRVNNVVYKCQCECGHLSYLSSYELRSGKSTQCMECGHKQAHVKHSSEYNIGDLTQTKYCKIRKGALARNIEFNVSMNYLWELYLLQDKKCVLTGDPLPNINKASLDRLDSTKGYIEGNVQWVTKQANISKHTMSMDELYEFCKKVLNHANQQPSQPLTKLEGSETNS